ncbi:MAG: ion channel [Methylotenera sp.]|nr:ion channel [Methylotenera sp.]
MWPVVEVILGFILIICTLTIHSIGMYTVMHRFELNWSVFLNEKNEFRRQLYLGYLVVIMLITHVFEVLLIAVVLYAIHAFHDLRTAFYFTGETYTTLGFGDILLPSGWRQLALFIAMSGLFAFGWSTGVLVSIVGKTYEAQFSNLRK